MNLAIKNYAQISRAIEDRLLSGFQINNRKSAHSDCGAIFDNRSLFVRSAMRYHATHRVEKPFALRNIGVFLIYKSCDSTHINFGFGIADSRARICLFLQEIRQQIPWLRLRLLCARNFLTGFHAYQPDRDRICGHHYRSRSSW